MSDNSVGATGLMSDDGEPSMEDILSSIRRIIAEDKSSEAAAQPDFDDSLDMQSSNEPAFTPEAEALAPQDDFISASTEAVSPPAADALDADSFALEDLTLPEPEPEAAAPQDGTASVEGGADTQDMDDILELVSYADDEAPTSLDDEVNSGLDLAFETEDDGGFETLSAAEIEQSAPAENLSLLEQQDVLDTSARGAEADDDIDLVKSLLADLMDDEDEAAELELDIPDPDAASLELDAVAGSESADPVLDDTLAAAIDDEIALAQPSIESALQDAEAKEAVVSEAAYDSDDSESDLARIAREAREASQSAMQAASEDAALSQAGLSETEIDSDRVDIQPASSLAEKLALGGAALGGAGLAAAALSGQDDEDQAPDITGAVDAAAAEQQITEHTDSIAETETETKSGQDGRHKESEMVKLVKADTLVDEDTAEEAGGAFASLSEQVKKKAELEESGPPIGDLVQQALKPMLKEWLDANLKGIVERAVTKEVKRISSGK